MTGGRWEQVRTLFGDAMERPPSARAEFLRSACGNDPDLLREVQSLLASHDDAGTFLDPISLEMLAGDGFPEDAAPRIGMLAGPYRIVRFVAHGGMGEVYEAVRDDGAFRKRVAVKLVRSGFSRTELLRRFEVERQLLATLVHPNIAQLIDAGTTNDGVPYLIMEYVDGSRIDEYCDEHRLSIDERLELFLTVCTAIQFAHQNLVVHRDIKPSNILVTPEGTPKLLDFGIAKLASEQPAGEPATADQGTQPGQGFMTTEYASPEQVRGETVTTVSDVYSLGVLLYKLLTGRKPYDFKSPLPFEVSQTIIGSEPARPSSRETLIAATHGKKTVRRTLAGDLDNIVLTALRKETARRYPSVERLSEDIHRYRNREPVLASQDSRRYRILKFVQRNRTTVTAGLLIVACLLGALAMTLHQVNVATREKARAESINAFLKQMLTYSNPLQGVPGKNINQTTITEVLDQAATRISRGEFSDQPDVRAELERILGEGYGYQGKYDLMEQHLRSFVDLQRQLSGKDDPRALDALTTWAALLFRKGDLSGSERMFRQSLPGLRNAVREGTIGPEILTDALSNFAYLRRTQGDSREAEHLFREVLDEGTLLPPDARFILGITRSTLASTQADQGNFSNALRTANEAVSESRRIGKTQTPDFGFELTVLGGFLTDEGNLAEADSLLREGERIFRKLLAPSHLWLGDNLRNQAASLYLEGRYATALSRVTTALSIYEQSFGPHYDQYPTALTIQGLIFTRMGSQAKGETVLRRALELRLESLPKGHFFSALAQSALGECLTAQHRFAEAEPLLLESWNNLERSQGSQNPRTLQARRRLVELYRAWQKPERAEQYPGEGNPVGRATPSQSASR